MIAAGARQLKVHVRITSRDIDQGEPRSTTHDALALAVRRAVKAAGFEIVMDHQVQAMTSYCRVEPVHGHDWVGEWPTPALRFLRAYDAAGPRFVSPLDFDLMLRRVID